VRGESRLQINPIINSEMWYPVSCPTMTQVIKLRLDDGDDDDDDDENDDGIDVMMAMLINKLINIIIVIIIIILSLSSC